MFLSFFFWTFLYIYAFTHMQMHLTLTVSCNMRLTSKICVKNTCKYPHFFCLFIFLLQHYVLLCFSFPNLPNFVITVSSILHICTLHMNCTCFCKYCQISALTIIKTHILLKLYFDDSTNVFFQVNASVTIAGPAVSWMTLGKFLLKVHFLISSHS